MYKFRKYPAPLAIAVLTVTSSALGNGGVTVTYQNGDGAPQIISVSEPEYPMELKAARHLRAGTIIQRSDIAPGYPANKQTASQIAELLGQEVKRGIYAGKVINAGDIGPPTTIVRNAILTIEFERGPLRIVAEGRALDSGAIGETIRVMNLSSKAILSAVIVDEHRAKTK